MQFIRPPKSRTPHERKLPKLTVKRLVVGLAGGVAGGKSTVAAFFRKQGARIIDADVIGHEVLDLPAVRARLVRAWGRGVLRDGRVDRPALARAAFRSRSEGDRLNRIVHPVILGEIRRRLRAARGWVVLDAALLFESGCDALCDRVVFVDAPRPLRIRRAASRGWSRGELARRERLQWPASAKRKRADYVIDNTGSKSRTERQLENVREDLRRLR